ncbi:hypothetical protein [Nocardioides convexus]|uniref:hypothetical protein n=1 Tax=Nocardioides convexus TaxID=2712224 RepID=UPI00241817E9|nr:hypothetical protein [Nocardioides convexus]
MTQATGGGVFTLDPAAVNVERPGAVGEDVGRDGAGEGLAGDDDRLEGGLECGAPAFPPLSVGRGGYGDRREVEVPAGVRVGVIAAAHVGPRLACATGLAADDLPLGASRLVDRLGDVE